MSQRFGATLVEPTFSAVLHAAQRLNTASPRFASAEASRVATGTAAAGASAPAVASPPSGASIIKPGFSGACELNRESDMMAADMTTNTVARNAMAYLL